MNKTGRPKKFRNDAERQKAYRARKKWEKARSIRFDALRKSPMGRNRDTLYAGDACVLCGLTVHWLNQARRNWSLSFPQWRNIQIIYWQGWKQTPDNWLLCPDCANGQCEQPIALDPMAKISSGDFKEYLKRTGVKS